MASITAHQAIRAADFIDSMGVNTHMGWLDTGYGDAQQVADQLAYIGLHNIRDGDLWSGAIPQFQALGEHGIEATIFLPSGDLTNLDQALTDIKALGSMVEAIEGPNEVDLWPVQYQGMTGNAAMQALQQDLFNKVNSDPALAHVEVDQYTVGDWTNYSQYSDASAYADFAVSHYYPNNGLAPSYGIPDNDGFDYARDMQGTVGGNDVLRITETGYASGGGAGGNLIAVDEEAQGKYIPRLFAEAFNHGIDTTYTYQLMDAWAEQDPADPEHWWGLFRPDGSAKPAATALHNLMSVIGDADESFASTPLSYGLTGMPDSADALLLQKADGVYNLLLWNDVSVWNAETQTSITVAAAPITLDFAVAPSQVILHDTLTGVSTSLTTAKQMTIEVPDHVVVLEVHAGDETVSPPVVETPAEGVPADTVIGTGSDTLVLHVSQDAWGEDAQYTVSVDGQQIGGTLTAHASHSLGEYDTVTVKGSWAAGDHTLTVLFLNDAWGGTDDTDRNLHVEGITYDGEAVAGGTAALMSTDPAVFTLTDHTAPDVDWAL